MQCIDKFKAEKKAKKSKSDDDDDDSDDSADLGLSALPGSLLEEHKEEDQEAEAEWPFAKLHILYSLGGALMVVTGVAAFAARQQVFQCQPIHRTLSTEEGFQEDSMFES
jgi:hypothetical protein